MGLRIDICIKKTKQKKNLELFNVFMKEYNAERNLIYNMGYINGNEEMMKN